MASQRLLCGLVCVRGMDVRAAACGECARRVLYGVVRVYVVVFVL